MELRLRNFQAWSEARLELRGLTSVVGDSSLGKSSFARAIRKAVRNELMPNNIKLTTPKASIHFLYKGLDLLVERGAKVELLKGTSAESDKGKGWLIVDDLVDTGVTARAVRAMLPEAHFATVYAKPAGRPVVDSYITEVSQDTWILFPWDQEAVMAKTIIELKGAGK